MKIQIINGPNLNLLGKREPEKYGMLTFEEWLSNLKSAYPLIEFEYFQSNIEGELINKIHEAGFSFNGIVLNPGGYTHTSVSLADAVASVKAPVIEVHITNIAAREEFRHISLVGRYCAGSIIGFGLDGYRLAVEAITGINKNPQRKGMIKKRTKIVATISDKRCGKEFIKELYEEGMDVIRINSAHLNTEGALKIINNAREVSDKIAILLDTKGPEIRTTVCDAPIKLKKGSTILISGDPDKTSSDQVIYVSYKSFSEDIPEGTAILIDDGELELRALKRNGEFLECLIENDGVLGSRKSVNLPGVKICLPSLTQKDKTFLKMAVENGVDFIAHSFVRSRQDVLDVQAILDEYKSDIRIIAKIENEEGVEHIDEILEAVYGIMVARGDLAIEIPYEKVPGIQRMIISKCIDSRKPVIVATQMLHSMITNPRPTRAEVSDIASAIYSQTDAIMLSGETASGKYPVEAVKTMTKVALEVENNKEKFLDLPAVNVRGEISAYLAKVAVKTSVRIGAKGIIADTIGGRSIRDMASYRGYNLILAQCYSTRTMRELALSYGVYASYQERKKSIDDFINIALRDLIKRHDLKKDDIIVVLAGNFTGGSGFSFIEVGTVEYLKSRVDIID